MFSTAQAQLPNGSIAPDWTLTDINGNEHTLYSYLDQGYTVIIDFSWVLCGYCWQYHLDGDLEELYANHGPAGMEGVNETTTDDVMVFMIEAKGANVDQLNGVYGSLGDWVTGTHFPIFTDMSLNTDYALFFFPTVYTICPDRVLTHSSIISADAHYNLAGQCEGVTTGIEEISSLNTMTVYPNPANETVNVSFELNKSLETTVEITNLLGEKVQVLNLGTLSLGSQKIELDLSDIDNGLYFISLSGEGDISTKKIRVTK